MKVALLEAILLIIIITGAERCRVEKRDSVCNFDINQPCTYELTLSSCDVNVTVSENCYWRWRGDNQIAFKQSERGFGSAGSHFWCLKNEEIFQRANESFDIKCLQRNLTFGPISLLLATGVTSPSSDTALLPTAIPTPNPPEGNRPGDDKGNDVLVTVFTVTGCVLGVSGLLVVVSTIVAVVVKKLKRGRDRRENTTAESDVQQCTSQDGGRPVYNAAYLPLPGTIRKRQSSTTNLRLIPDEAGAEKDPDEEPHVTCPSPAERERKASVVCESLKRSTTGSPSVGRSRVSSTEISGVDIELPLLPPSPRDSSLPSFTDAAEPVMMESSTINPLFR